MSRLRFLFGLTALVALACDKPEAAPGGAASAATSGSVAQSAVEPSASPSAAVADDAAAPTAAASGEPTPSASSADARDSGSTPSAEGPRSAAGAGALGPDGGGESPTPKGKAASKSSVDSVKLLSPGAAPLQKLRYAFVAQKTDRLDMTTTSELDVMAGGKSLPAPSAPGVQVVAALTVLAVDAEGTADRELAFEKVSLLPGPGLDMKTRKNAEENLKSIEKLTGKDRVDARGFVRSVTLDASKVDNPVMKQTLGAMQQTFDQMGAPFPEPEVGVGARWQVKTKLEQMGIKLEQTATYELVSFEKDHGKIKLKLQQKAPGGTMQLPGLPAGATAKLVGMTGTGAGELAFELGRGVPDGHIDTNTEVKVQVSMADAKQEMITRLKARVRFKPLAAK